MLVRLKNDTDMEWLSDSGELIQGNIETLAKDSRARNVSFIAPAHDVLLMQLELPTVRRRHQLLQAIPYALEETLSDDVETYHIALPRTLKKGTVHVAIVSKTSMQTWLSNAATHGIHVTAIYPAPLLLAYAPDSWTLAHVDGTVSVRTGEYSGFSALDENFPLFLAAQAAPPTTCYLHNYTDTPVTYQIPGLTSEQHSQSDYLRDSEKLTSSCPINLCQGDYIHRGQTAQLKRWWYTAGALCIIALLVVFVNNIVTGVIYQAKNRARNSAIDAIYQHYFPQATTIVAPKERMMGQLQIAESGASGNPYLDITARVAHVMAPLYNIQLHSMQFSDNSMTLFVSSKNFGDIKVLMSALEATGLHVTQQQASASKGMTQSTLLITETQ